MDDGDYLYTFVRVEKRLILHFNTSHCLNLYINVVIFVCLFWQGLQTVLASVFYSSESIFAGQFYARFNTLGLNVQLYNGLQVFMRLSRTDLDTS
jgi:hypothetical protein